MKKNVLLLAAVLCAVIWGNAQVIQGYGFGATVGTYEEITDGTLIYAKDVNQEGNVKTANTAFFPDTTANKLITEPGFPIGFDFEFNDIICNQFAVGFDGYVAVGRDEICINPSSGRFLLNQEGEGKNNLFGVLINNSNYAASDSTTVSYKLIGEAPNRKLVVQYTNVIVPISSTDVDLDLQIAMYETSNNIEFVFRNWNTDAGNADVRVGLHGTEGDIHTRISDNDDWMNTTMADGSYFSMGKGVNIPDGLTYTFTMPAACEAPATPATDLVATISTDMIEGSFTKSPDADHYLVLISSEENLSQLPENGTFYEKRDSLGNAYILQYDTISTFETIEDLVGNTTYYVTVIAANSYCKQGPVYATENPLKVALTTMPTAPQEVKITGGATDRISFTATVNEAGQQMLIALTDSMENRGSYTWLPYTGTPSGTYQIGDYITEDGGKVVYIGGTITEDIVIEGLEPGRSYYLRAFSMNDNGGYSTHYADAATATYATLPYQPDFNKEERYGLPGGWTETGGKFRLTNSANNNYGIEKGKMVLECNINKGNAAGLENTLTTQPIVMTQRDAAVTFIYSMGLEPGRGQKEVYSDWDERDSMAIQVSKNGIDFEDVKVYTSANNIKQESMSSFVTAEADLSAYVNDTIQIRLYWKTYKTAGHGNFFWYIDSLQVAGREIPKIPVIAVENVTFNSATATWRGAQESYEFASCKEGEEWSYVVTTEKQMELIDLTHETNYQVKVRGIVAENDTTDWSNVVTFTTAELPECPVPTELTTTTDDEALTTTATWTGSDEHLAWELHYRPANVTSWTTVEGLAEETYTFTELEPKTVYLWSVRASCTFDRTSRWATQDEFISASSAVSFATADDLRVVALNNSISILNNGIFIKDVTLYDMQGRVINHSAINCDVNVLMPVNAEGVVLVKVTTVDDQFVYKVSM